MANAVKNERFSVAPMVGVVEVNPLIEPGANEAEAIPFAMDAVGNYPEWTYSETAEDNGTAGILDLQPGLVYEGPQGMYVQVSIRALDVSAALLGFGVGAPAATDTSELAIYVNSVLKHSSDEGPSTEIDDSTIEFNLDGHVGPLNESDVIRVVLAATGEEADADLRMVSPAVITIR